MITGVFVPEVIEPVAVIGRPYLSWRRFSKTGVLVPVAGVVPVIENDPVALSKLAVPKVVTEPVNVTEPLVPDVAPRSAAISALSRALRITVSLRADCCVAPMLARAAARARAAMVSRMAPIAMNNASMSITMSRSMPRRVLGATL